MSGLRYQELLLMEEILHQWIYPIIYKVLYILCIYIYIPGGAGFLPSPVLNLTLSWFSMDPTHQFSLILRKNTWNTCSAARNLKNNMGRKNIKINQSHLQSINQFWVLHLISVMKFMMETICFFFREDLREVCWAEAQKNISMLWKLSTSIYTPVI